MNQEPPLLKGGQGRSDQSIHDDSVAARVIWAIGILLSVVGFLFLVANK